MLSGANSTAVQDVLYRCDDLVEREALTSEERGPAKAGPAPGNLGQEVWWRSTGGLQNNKILKI